MRKFIPVFVVALAMAAIAACGNNTPNSPNSPNSPNQNSPAAGGRYAPGQTAAAYDYVHGGYVGRAIARTDSEGAFSVELDEAFLPHTLAIVDMESDDWNEDNTVYYVQRNNQVRVAKHIAYNGTNYTGVTVGSALVFVASDDEGNPAGGTDLELQIIRSEARMAEYWESIGNGGFEIFTEFGGDPIPVTTTAYGSVYKRGSTYWNFGLGWQGNIDAMEAAAAEHGVRFTLDEMNRRQDDNLWELADAVTAATLTDFPDYFALIQTASARLKVE